MATPKYTALAEITLTTTDSEIVFSSIPATYRDLVLVVDGTASGTIFSQVQVNGDTGNNYSFVGAIGDGASTFSDSGTTTTIPTAYNTTNATKFMFQMNFMDYSVTDKHKTVLNRFSQSSSGQVIMRAHRWANTAAINSIRIYTASSSFAAGSTFCLYGVK